MLILAKFLSMFIVSIGIIFLLSPNVLKQYIVFWGQGKRIYAGGILNILIGILLFMVASQCRLAGVVRTMAVLSLVKGIIILGCGLEKMKVMLKWWDKLSPLAVRVIAIVVIGIGILFFYSI